MIFFSKPCMQTVARYICTWCRDVVNMLIMANCTVRLCIIRLWFQLHACFSLFMLLFRYWIHKDQNMKWMPIGHQFRRLLDDVRRVWPSPGEEGLHLVQVGSTVPSARRCPTCVAQSRRGRLAPGASQLHRVTRRRRWTVLARFNETSACPWVRNCILCSMLLLLTELIYEKQCRCHSTNWNLMITVAA